MPHSTQNANPGEPDQILARFERTHSLYRLKPYRRNAQSATETMACYLWNIALCEALYPAFHFFEVAYRNALNDALSKKSGGENGPNPRWFMDGLLLKEYHQSDVQNALDRLQHKGKPVMPLSPTAPYPMEPQRVVAELSMGFWITLYSDPYRVTIFGPTVASVFPKSPKSVRSQGLLYPRLQEVLDLRNRVSHHEPLWRDRQLAAKHQNIVELLGWMDAEQPLFLAAVDRFATVYGNGWEAFADPVDYVFMEIADRIK